MSPSIHASVTKFAMPRPYYRRVLNLKRANLIAYWPLYELSGATADNLEGTAARDATYTNCTLGQTGIGDGKKCPSLGGTAYINALTASLQAAFNGAEGTLMVWARVANVGVWTDGIARMSAFIAVDANNYLDIGKTTTNNQMRFRYMAGSTIKQILYTMSPTAFFCAALSWSATADQVKAFVNGAQVGSTATTLGTWAGALATAILGASSAVPATPWSGYLAHAALWTAALYPAQILWLSRPWMGR
jgi:hypothetical protein